MSGQTLDDGGQSKSIHAQIFMQRPGMNLTQRLTVSNTSKNIFEMKRIVSL